MPSGEHGFFAHGATFLFNGYPVEGLLDIPLPDEAREEVEITSHSSNFQRQFVPGLKDNGEFDLTMRMIPDDAGQIAMRENAALENEIVEMQIQLPDHVANLGYPVLRWTFDGFVRARGGTLFWESTAAERTITIRISGGVAEEEVSI